MNVHGWKTYLESVHWKMDINDLRQEQFLLYISILQSLESMYVPCLDLMNKLQVRSNMYGGFYS